MSFVCKYGSEAGQEYVHPEPVEVQQSVTNETRDELNRVISQAWTYTCTSWLLAADLPALNVLIAALKAAYAVENQRFKLASPAPADVSTDIDILPANTVGGVLVAIPPHGADPLDAVYADGVPWKYSWALTFVVETIIDPGAGGTPTPTAWNVVGFKEDYVSGGGGPVKASVAGDEPTQGPAQSIQVIGQAAFTLRQTGTVTGRFRYPDVPPPRFPESLLRYPEINNEDPHRFGYTGKQRTFTRSYSYEFENATQPFVVVTPAWPEAIVLE